MANIKTVFMGTPDFAVPVLETLIKMSDVKLVVTKQDAMVGRKKVVTFPPVKKIALDHNIEVFQPLKIREDFAKIKEINPDLIVTCAYGQILPKEILNIPKLGCINVHASLLPEYRGGAPIQRAIMDGKKVTGISIMYMDELMDTGDIIAVSSLSISKTDTASTLHDKLSVLASSLLEQVLPSIINKTNAREKQDDSKASYAAIIKREDEHLDFNNPADLIDNKVRALYSWPLAYIILKNEETKILEGFVGGEATKVPGSIEDISSTAIGISCLDKIYYVTKIKPFGKKAMDVKDYLNGINKESLKSELVK